MRRRIHRKNRRVRGGIADNLPKKGQMIWIARDYYQTVIHARRISQETGIPLSEMFMKGLSLWLMDFRGKGAGDFKKAIQISNEQYAKAQELKRERKKLKWAAFKLLHPDYIPIRQRKKKSSQSLTIPDPNLSTKE